MIDPDKESPPHEPPPPPAATEPASARSAPEPALQSAAVIPSTGPGSITSPPRELPSRAKYGRVESRSAGSVFRQESIQSQLSVR